MLPTSAGVEPATSCLQSDGAFNLATEAGRPKLYTKWHLIFGDKGSPSNNSSLNCWFVATLHAPRSLKSSATFCFNSLHACWVILHAFLSVDFSNLFKNIFQEYHQSVKQFGSRSGPTKCRAWSGSKLFAKVISRRQKSPLAGKESTKTGDVVMNGILYPYASKIALWRENLSLGVCDQVSGPGKTKLCSISFRSPSDT